MRAKRVLRYRVEGGVVQEARFYLRDEGGNVLSEFQWSPSDEWTRVSDTAYLGRRPLVRMETTPGGDRTYTTLVTDHLDSVRAEIFDATYTSPAYNTIDYWPFGELVSHPATLKSKHLFTGHEREFTGSATGVNTLEGLDYMHARYYSPNLGRFLSVDQVWGSVGSSQSWNRYSYVLNNPLVFNDPDGERQNPVTGGQGINNTPQRGTLGRIRATWNPRVGQFGLTRNGGTRFHAGIDVNAPSGTPVFAAEAGVVTDVGARGVAGNRVQITMEDGTVLTYAHLDSASVNSGDRLYEGQQVGDAGTSGNAAGMPADQEHLHFGVTDAAGNRVDPQACLNDSSADPPATMAEENIFDPSEPIMTEIPEP